MPVVPNAAVEGVPPSQYVNGRAQAVSAIVMQDGTVGEVHVLKSLDKNYGFADEAVKAPRLWRFKPGMRFGQPVNVQVTIELTFRLK